MNINPTSHDIKIAVIGGGTGSFTLLTALKNHTTKLAALVSMADDGGSTGVLRDELGALPPGDIRQCLVALSRSSELRDLFNYRFEEGGLSGHAFGNLFLTALEKMTGDFAAGVEVASEVLDIVGVVEPITLTNVRLMIEDINGTVTQGEMNISKKDFQSGRPKVWLEPAAEANPRAVSAIYHADMVIIAPGDIYRSIAPALVVPGIGQALKKSKAVKIYVSNLVTKPGQTDGFGVSDLADEIERFSGSKFLDYVLYNTKKPNDKLLKKYAHDGEESVIYDESKFTNKSYIAIGRDLISNRVWKNTNRSDPLSHERTLIRHDSDLVVKALISLYVSHMTQI